MKENNRNVVTETTKKRFGLLQVSGIIVVASFLTAVITIMIFKTYLFPSEFKPVTLNPQEKRLGDYQDYMCHYITTFRSLLSGKHRRAFLD